MVLHIVNFLPSSTYNVDDLGVQGLETSQPVGGQEKMGYKNNRSLPIEGHLVQSSCFCGTSVLEGSFKLVKCELWRIL